MSGITDWTSRFAARFEQLKREKGLTQEKLADELGVRQTTISRWKKGARRPSLEQFEQLADALAVPLEWLLFGDVARLSEDERELIENYRAADNGRKVTIRSVAEIAADKTADNDDPPTERDQRRRPGS